MPLWNSWLPIIVFLSKIRAKAFSTSPIRHQLLGSDLGSHNLVYISLNSLSMANSKILGRIGVVEKGPNSKMFSLKLAQPLCLRLPACFCTPSPGTPGLED